MNTQTNTYAKFCPNVYMAKCYSEHSKGDIIEVTTQYGKVNECIVFNFLGKSKDGFYCYSIVRNDGFNYAENREDKLLGYARNAEKRAKTNYIK